MDRNVEDLDHVLHRLVDLDLDHVQDQDQDHVLDQDQDQDLVLDQGHVDVLDLDLLKTGTQLQVYLDLEEDLEDCQEEDKYSLWHHYYQTLITIYTI